MHVCSIYGIYMHAIKLAGKVAKEKNQAGLKG